MKNRFELNFLRVLLVFGILAFFNLMRKPPIKDWLIVFFLKSYIATFFDTIFVKKGYIEYPVNLFKGFNISVIFSYLIFPITCVYFNVVTKKASVMDIIFKSFLFSVPMTIAETWLERTTQLISYKKSWNWIHSLVSITSTFLLVRFAMELIRQKAAHQAKRSV